MSLGPLLACAGKWTGTNVLEIPVYNIYDQSAATLTLTPISHNRFVRLDYTWSYKDEPQEGSMWIGFDPEAQRAVIAWIDTWHMGYDIMTLRGAIEGNAVNVLGSWAAPEGPDWGWRIVVTAGSEALTVTMYNIPPSGEEILAVTATYERA